MKLSKNKLGVMVGAALSLGVAGQASADVYGLSSLQVSNLLILFNASTGAAGAFSFSTNQDAALNGFVDGSSGAANCAGAFPSEGTCTGSNPVLSGTVQNAPGGAVVRAENDYQKFGTVAQYSNAESAIVTAVLAGDASTSTKAISESNLQSGTSAQANTNVTSNTFLNLTFEVNGNGGGAFSIAFDAVIDVLSKTTGVDIAAGLAQANSGLTVILQKAGVALASWAPTGTNNVTICAAGLTCTATEAATSLNNSTSAFDVANQVTGSGNYRLDVTGLTTGIYTLALATTTSTDLARFPVPVPGTLLLMGIGLLAGAGALRRNKSVA